MMDKGRYGPWCLITGGSDGIGAAFAERLAREGFNLVLVARRTGPLDALASRLRSEAGIEVRTISTDLARADAVDVVAGGCEDIEIGLLVCNAGAAPKMVDFLDQPEDEAMRTTYINTIGQTAFAARFGAAMRRRGRGGIILLGSLAFAAGVGRLATYAASKAYSTIFAEGLWYELRPHGVDVLGVVATTTRTPTVQRMGMPLDNPAYPAVEPERVAEEVLAALGRGPLHYMDNCDAIVRSIQAMPRDEAVEMVSRGMEQAVPRDRG